MTNFVGVTVTFDVENTPQGKEIVTSISGYGSLIASGFGIPNDPDRDIVVMTDRQAYEDLTGNKTSGYSGQISAKIAGQYTIFVDPTPVAPGTIRATPGQIAVHEVMHITHPGLGKLSLHKTEFYVQQERVLSELGLGAYSHQSVAGSGLYSGGNLLERSISRYGVSETQIEILAQIYGPEDLSRLSQSLTNLYGQDFGLSTGYEGVTGNALAPVQCFLSDTAIQMWPLDPSINPRADGSYDEELVLSHIWQQPIEDIEPNDLVLSYDKSGCLQPGRVTQLFRNTATHILDFWGVGVTPGHAYLCADDGRFAGEHVPILDILRSDGAVARDDGTLIRAATGCAVGSAGDQMMHVVIGHSQPDGTTKVEEVGQIRAGTRVILNGDQDVSVMELIAANNAIITEDGYVQNDSGRQKMPFRWTLTDHLPKPEDYILARSDVDLDAIYLAGEWEQIGTQMPSPTVGSDASPSATIGAALQPSKPLPNIPLAFVQHPDAPKAGARRKQPSTDRARQGTRVH